MEKSAEVCSGVCRTSSEDSFRIFHLKKKYVPSAYILELVLGIIWFVDHSSWDRDWKYGINFFKAQYCKFESHFSDSTKRNVQCLRVILEMKFLKLKVIFVIALREMCGV